MDAKRIFHCALPVFLIVLFLLLRILPEVTGKPLFRSAVYIAHLVLTLKDYLDEQALPFYSLTLYLRGAYNTATRDITVENLLWESIYEEGMEERIAAHLSP